MSNVRWHVYDFIVYDPKDTKWNDIGGVYIFTGPNVLGKWMALYIGETGCFMTRMPRHDRWSEAVRLGATHVHALVASPEANRVWIQDELIRLFQPPLNTQGR
jgi:hypothetical protein